MKLSSAALICITAVGCGTMRNVSPHALSTAQPVVPEKFVYGGVKDDLAHVRSAIGDIKHFPESERAVARNIATATAYTFDIPASAAADTLTLPITIPAAIDRAVGRHYFPDENVERMQHDDSTMIELQK